MKLCSIFVLSMVGLVGGQGPDTDYILSPQPPADGSGCNKYSKIKLKKGNNMCLSYRYGRNPNDRALTGNPKEYFVIAEKCDNGKNKQKWTMLNSAYLYNKEAKKCLQNEELVDCDYADHYGAIPVGNNGMLLANAATGECLNFESDNDRKLAGRWWDAETDPCKNDQDFKFNVPPFCFFQL